MHDHATPLLESRSVRVAAWLLLMLLAVGGFFHLGADFPNHSRWTDDAAKFTDEGWYASGALNHILTGQWLRPGDFNPMVTIPVWSVLLEAIFHFTGISIVLARGLAFLFTLGSVAAAGALLRRDHPRLAPLFMLLLLGNPLLYFFSRIAILEPALLFFLVASALAAYRAADGSRVKLVLCGVLFVLAMLTKSSAVFAGPAIVYLLWFPFRATPRAALRVCAVPLLTVVVLYGAWWLLVVRTHPADVRVLYGQNIPYLGVKSIEKAIRIVYRSFSWVDSMLYPLALIAFVASLTRMRSLWRDPLFGFAVLAYVGYSGFLLVHFDAGPRYFAVLAFPVLLIVLLFQRGLRDALPAAANLVAVLVLFAVALNLLYIGRMMLRPSYTLRDAQLGVRRVIDADPAATRLVLGHGALESSFVTHIPALDDLGEMTVRQKLARFHPGWVLTYSDALDILQPSAGTGNYNFVLLDKYPVLDSPGRQYLMLYRIVPR